MSARFHLMAATLLSLAALAPPAAEAQRAPARGDAGSPIRVRLVSEEPAPSCGGRLVLTHRACIEVRRCRRGEAPDETRRRLAAALERVATQRAGMACRDLGCPGSSGTSGKQELLCEDRRTLCLEQTSWWRCDDAEARPARIPRKRPGRTKFSAPPPELPAPDLGLAAGPDPRWSIRCVEPPASQRLAAPPKRAPRRTRKRAPVAPALPLSGKGDAAQLVFAGAASTSITDRPPTSCEGITWQQFHSLGTVHPAMPPVNFPKQPCDDDEHCVEVRLAWARAHHNVWAARAILHFIASRPSSEQRRFLWSRTGVRKNGKPLYYVDKGEDPDDASDDTVITDYYTLEYWFGPYSDKVFTAVKTSIDKLWDVMTSNETGGIEVELICPEPQGTVCNSKKNPSAHHFVRGKIHLCDNFLDDMSGWAQAHTITHELLHHLWTKWGKAWVAIQDIHYHGHGVGCGLSPKSEAMYGHDNIRHLATYRNKNGSSCGHQARDVRNNDTYAWYITAVGDAVYRGSLHKWPEPVEPTPQAPQCTGGENCLCETKDSFPLNKPFVPDGDFDAQHWCDDNDGEMTCRTKKYSGKATGICVKCDKERGPGCECDAQRPCDVGSCWGADTFGGGVGHCWEGTPPVWACLADCRRLFNDQGAWCYADYPTGKARCMDSLCSEPKAWECAEEGEVCRYGECVVECNDDADCAEKGYPGVFHCVQHRCEVP